MTWPGERQRHTMSARGVQSSRRRQRLDSGRAKNLKMDDDVYKLRREVMKYIYEAKTLCVLPRLDIRITEEMGRNTVGLARMKDKILWIPEDALKDDLDMRAIVYHEILHAVYGVQHDPNCKLMSPYVETLTKVQADRLFKKQAKMHGGDCT